MQFVGIMFVSWSSKKKYGLMLGRTWWRLRDFSLGTEMRKGFFVFFES